MSHVSVPTVSPVNIGVSSNPPQKPRLATPRSIDPLGSGSGGMNYQAASIVNTGSISGMAHLPNGSAQTHTSQSGLGGLSSVGLLKSNETFPMNNSANVPLPASHAHFPPSVSTAPFSLQAINSNVSISLRECSAKKLGFP